jgi:hypothetical protein
MIARIFYSCIAGILFTGCAMASINPDTNTVFTIYHYKAPGVGESVQLCYVIKKNNGDRQLFYSQIEGFDYQWGYNYTISVEKKMNKAPMADASSFTYRLRKVLKKEKVAAGETFELRTKINDQVLVENKNGICSYFGEIEIQTGSHSCADLAKAQSATFRHADNGRAIMLVKLK